MLLFLDINTNNAIHIKLYTAGKLLVFSYMYGSQSSNKDCAINTHPIQKLMMTYDPMTA